MLIPNQTVEVHWCPANKKHYEALGYEYTSMRKPLVVKAEDLMRKSTIRVMVECDYGHEIYETPYKVYLNSIEKFGKACCYSCQNKKFKESSMAIYGVDNPFASEEVKEKIKATNIEKYGVEYVRQNEEVKNKIKKTNLERYGNEYAIASKEIRDKSKATNIEKYGVANIFQLPETQERIKAYNLEKYGVEYYSQTQEYREQVNKTNMEKWGVPFTTQSQKVIKKMRATLSKNGTVPTSKAEQEMCKNLIELYGTENVIPAFPYEELNFDCLVKINEVLIDVEYDGWYWHKNKQEYDKRRNYFLTRRGYKVLRFQANNAIPTKEELKEAIEELVKDSKMVKIVKLDI